MSKIKQPNLFGDLDDLTDWYIHWKNMPEFIQEDETPFQQIIVSFETKEDVKLFEKLVNQKLTYKTKSLWFPKIDEDKPSDYVYTKETKL